MSDESNEYLDRIKPQTFGEAADYMRETLKEIDQKFSSMIFSTPIISADKIFIPPDPGPNGRDEPAAYEDPLNDVDLVDDVLDSDLIVRMKSPPQDPLDLEAHVESCESCRQQYGSICAHCLELKICEAVAIEGTPIEVVNYTVNSKLEVLRHTLGLTPRRLQLCRQCRNSAQEGALDVE